MKKVLFPCSFQSRRLPYSQSSDIEKNLIDNHRNLVFLILRGALYSYNVKDSPRTLFDRY